MPMKYLSRPILIAALLTIALSLTVLWTWPQYQEFQELRGQAIQLQARIENRDQYAVQLRDIQEGLQAEEAKLSQVNAALPDGVSLPALYEVAQGLAASSGMVLSSLSVSVGNEETLSGSPASGGEEGFREISVSLALAGSYEDLKNFLASVNRASRFFEVSSVGFGEGAGAEQEEGVFEFGILLKGYAL